MIGGKWAPADLSGAWNYRDDEFKRGWAGKTHSGFCMPLDDAEWRLFLGTHYTQHKSMKIVHSDPLQAISSKIWSQIDTSGLDKLENSLRLRDTERNRRLQ